ncbi:TPA: hypothetical protein ACKP7E_001786 [Pseudomonas aeruginosa]
MEMNKAMELLRGLVSEIERQTCEHAETHRGGAIWEICDSCGAKWADDEGGKPEFEWPESVEKAREFLAAHPTVEQAGGDERVIGWRERILAAHPNSDPGFWPDALLVEHMAAEIADLRADLAQPSPMPPDRGPWHAVKWDGGRRVDLSSDDFEHDVALTVSGDFVEGDKFRYAQELAAWMNAHLAQPSPARADEKPGDSILCYGCFAKGVGPDHFDEAGKCLARQQTEPLGAEFAQVLSDNLPELLSTAQAEKAEGFTRFPELMESVQQMDAMLKANSAQAERPEVVARVVHSNPVVLDQCAPLNANDELMTVAQHAASVARWAEMFNRVEQERDAALASVAELDKQCRDDVARALGLRPSQERGFAWSYLLASIKSCVKASEDAAQAQHSVPEEFSFEYRHPNGECHTVTVSRDQVINEMPDFLFEALCSKFCNCEPVGETNVVECCCDEYAEEFKLIAAAPGKEVGHE